MESVSFREKMRLPDLRRPEEVIFGKVKIDHEKCTGCEACVKICVADALVMENGKCRMKIAFDEGGECVCCSDCQAMCPQDAITIVSPNRYTYYYKTINIGELLPPRL